ncbi:MFS transporter [Pigmentiphaga aceris]|uniref:MFS transporter n=1 Tax=Pigmentiphaga aceris TaxID=1940612 RepID=A0A5C0AYY3_9BURK|nr:MFS transporter [Pigmentiphaga aceris]QEI07395.1 MFS transporter [Pigmentiphaga aceris]
MNRLHSRSPVTWLVILSLFNHVGYTGTRFVALLSVLALSDSPFIAGALLATLSLVPMLTSLPLGRWIDRHHKAGPMRLGAAMTAAGCFLPIVFQDVVGLFVSVALVGTGYNIHQISLQSTMGRAASDLVHRTRLFTWLSLCVSTSMVVSPLIAGFGIEHGGYRVAQAIVLLGPLATLGLLWHRRKQLALEPALAASPRPAPAKPAPVTLVTPAGTSWFGRWTSRRQARRAHRAPSSIGLLREPPVRQVLLASVAVSLAFDMHTFAVPLLGHTMALSPAEIGTIIAFFSAGTFAVRVAMQWLVRRVRGWTIVHGAMLTCAAGYYLYPLAPDTAVMCALSFVIGMALGSCQPNVLALLHEVVPHHRSGEAIALRVMFSYVSGFMLPLVFGALAVHLGVAPLFVAIATNLVVAWWFSRRPVQHKSSGDASHD